MEKRQALINSAIKLFARKGFDGTSTASIGRYAGVTEPLIHYHFKSKDGLFAYILKVVFSEYFSRLDALPKDTDTEFEKLGNLIRFHSHFAEDFPDETYIVVSACPAKLHHSAHICAQYVHDQGTQLNNYIATCLETGIKSGEFRQVPVNATTRILLDMVSELMRRKSRKLDQIDAMLETTIEFCRRALTLNK